MFIILLFLIHYSQQEQIIIYYPPFCAQYRYTFIKLANEFNLSILNIPSEEQSAILLNNSNSIIQYQWDVFELDIKYWLTIYFHQQLPILNMPVNQLNLIQENLLFFYGLNQSYYNYLLQLAYEYPLYMFYYANPHNHKIYQEFFIQNYSIQQDYLIIRRKQDNYDYHLLILSLDQIKPFLEKYSKPYQQQYFTMKHIAYLKQNQNQRAFLYISFNLYQFKENKLIIQKQSDIYRQSNQNRNVVFIITEPIFMAKTLLQRFLYKNIKDGPFLVYLEFNQFKFNIFNKEWNYYQVSQWMQQYIRNEFQSQLLTLNPYLQQIPFLTLSQQKVQAEIQNKLHSIAILDLILQKPQQQNILLIRLIPYCYKSFKLFSILSKFRNDNLIILYSLNSLIYDEFEMLMITKNQTLIIDNINDNSLIQTLKQYIQEQFIL
ncbi:unnamed protein product (macronuclear) [Paramecium tetraurelia]|uniref:Uncharacterized protein n=1 Tax=Paramecium tetraurelia TaxID=5888 RepID=A0CKX9_PARTE|nr:uncharacterized protein GSPATT00007993001 [Paramecium tetraurelia]CAK71446.1 unnamed protein product [Paramecium tetraurelia]|eukprot:XP_001438843.1 hypothetical protein (macronuclear) [Paramecium tetraurelia strain d4-2]